MKDREGVVRYTLETEVPEVDFKPFGEQIRRFGEEAYFFPISEIVKSTVHDSIAEAGDCDITRSIVMGKHMDLYTSGFQEKKLTQLASKFIYTLLLYRQGTETIEQVYTRLVSEVQEKIEASSQKYANGMGALEFAYRFGEAVAYGHLSNLPYDTEHTYLPTSEELEELNEQDPSSYQLTQISGFHASWQAENSINDTMIQRPSPFYRLLKMRAWGGHNFSIKDNDFNFEVHYGSALGIQTDKQFTEMTPELAHSIS